MARRVRLEPHLGETEPRRSYRRARDGTLRGWWHILWPLARGQTAKALAGSTGYSCYRIGQLAKRYNARGPAGLRDRRRTDSRRAPPLLTAAQQEELRQALRGPAPRASGGAGAWRPSGWRRAWA